MIKIKQLHLSKSGVLVNSAWGVASSILQTLFVSLFFAIIARKYYPDEFAHFLIANTVYQLMAAFSSMGLGQWFIREYLLEEDRESFTNKFLKTQIGLGIIFYFFNILLAVFLYTHGEIRVLCVILGTNIIFDNFINGIKSLNIAESKQKRTATILIIDGFLKLVVGCFLFINAFSLITLSVMLISVRVLTLSLFIKLGSSKSLNLKLIVTAKILMSDVKKIVVKNWQFIVIGSISIIYWRIGNIIISKTLTISNVADYELAFRIFSIFQILPVIASATIFPKFISFIKEKDFSGLKKFYETIFIVYSIFAFLSYAFIYSFSHIIIPIAFGTSYPGAVICLEQMFLTFLILPTVLLQANLIVALGLEKLDMWFNVISLIIYLLSCLIGLHLFKSLAVVNYSILISFTAFHLLQDLILIGKKITKLNYCILFYSALIILTLSYHYFTSKMNPYLTFLLFCGIIAIISTILIKNRDFKSFLSNNKTELK